jgi:hypothetical protein
MNLNKKLLLLGISLTLLIGCSNDDDDDPSNPANPTGGKVTITGASPQYTFWGDELTITGTGFSTVKDENVINFVTSYPKTPGLKLTSDGGDIEILSATATQIKIRVPYLTETGLDGVIHSMGEEFARIEVSVKNEKDTSDQVKFIGLPRVGKFEYHYGWFDLGGIARSGDSVVIDGGFYGMLSGAGELYPKEAGIFNKLRLRVNGIETPMKYRRITNSVKGWGIYLSASQFADIKCDDGSNGYGDRPMEFELYVLDTDKRATRTLNVTNLPEYAVTSSNGPEEISKSAGGNPFWTVEGQDMYFTKARFVSTCGSPTVEEEIATPGTINNDYQISIPLSLMVEQCGYTIHLITPCDEFELIGDVFIKP